MILCQSEEAEQILLQMLLFCTGGGVGKALSSVSLIVLSWNYLATLYSKQKEVKLRFQLHRALENIQVLVRWHLRHTVIEHGLRAPGSDLNLRYLE